MPTYPNTNIALLQSDVYFEYLQKRGLNIIRIQRTKTFEKTVDLELEVDAEHVWSYGDNLIKLAQTYYGARDYWWTIGFVNNKPTDAHFKIGDIVLIPRNPSLIVEALR